MVEVEQLRQQVESAKQLVEQKKAEAQEIERKLQESNIPRTTTQQALRGQYSSIQGRITRQQASSAQQAIQEGLRNIQGYKSGLQQYSQQVSGAEGQIAGYDAEVAAFNEAQAWYNRGMNEIPRFANPKAYVYAQEFSRGYNNAREAMQRQVTQFEQQNPGEKLVVDWRNLEVKGIQSENMLSSMNIPEYNRRVAEINDNLARYQSQRNFTPAPTMPLNAQGIPMGTVEVAPTLKERFNIATKDNFIKGSIGFVGQQFANIRERALQKAAKTGNTRGYYQYEGMQNIAKLAPTAAIYATPYLGTGLFIAGGAESTYRAPTVSGKLAGIAETGLGLWGIKGLKKPVVEEFGTVEKVIGKASNKIVEPKEMFFPLRKELKLDARAAKLREATGINKIGSIYNNAIKNPFIKSVESVNAFGLNVYQKGKKIVWPHEPQLNINYNRPGGYLGTPNNVGQTVAGLRRGVASIGRTVKGKTKYVGDTLRGYFKSGYPGAYRSNEFSTNVYSKNPYTRVKNVKNSIFDLETKSYPISRFKLKISSLGSKVYSKAKKIVWPHEPRINYNYNRPSGFIGQSQNTLFSRIGRKTNNLISYSKGKAKYFGDVTKGYFKSGYPDMIRSNEFSTNIYAKSPFKRTNQIPNTMLVSSRSTKGRTFAAIKRSITGFGRTIKGKSKYARDTLKGYFKSGYPDMIRSKEFSTNVYAKSPFIRSPKRVPNSMLTSNKGKSILLTLSQRIQRTGAAIKSPFVRVGNVLRGKKTQLSESLIVIKRALMPSKTYAARKTPESIFDLGKVVASEPKNIPKSKPIQPIEKSVGKQVLLMEQPAQLKPAYIEQSNYAGTEYGIPISKKSLVENIKPNKGGGIFGSAFATNNEFPFFEPSANERFIEPSSKPASAFNKNTKGDSALGSALGKLGAFSLGSKSVSITQPKVRTKQNNKQLDMFKVIDFNKLRYNYNTGLKYKSKTRQESIQKQRTKQKQRFRLPVPLLFKLKSSSQNAQVRNSILDNDNFDIFVRRRGRDIKVGTSTSRKQAAQQLFGNLKGGLGASGFVSSGGRKADINEFLGYGFRPSKRETGRVVQESWFRLGSFGERREIKQARRWKQPKQIKFNSGRKFKWF